MSVRTPRAGLPSLAQLGRSASAVATVALAVAAIACGSPEPRPDEGDATAPSPSPRWALAIHGGAGGMEREGNEERARAFSDGLTRALEIGRDRLEAGETSLDTCVAVIAAMEDDPVFNAGRGAVFNAAGNHELDASLMDGATLACGAVAGVRTVRNPIVLARRVMEDTPHVLLASEGAERFADEAGVERVENEWFSTDYRRRAFERWPEADAKGTVGCVALDVHGDLAAGTSTGGLTGKRFGRVGDSPVIGAGTYASNASCAVSATGIGEEFIRHGVARAIAARVEWSGDPPAAAARHLVHETLRPGDGGVIVVGADGALAAEYSTRAMLRGLADSSGRFEVAIWASGDGASGAGANSGGDSSGD